MANKKAETSLDRYPEFQTLVNEIVGNVVAQINEKASKVESTMPYKSQFVLEEVVRELNDRI